MYSQTSKIHLANSPPGLWATKNGCAAFGITNPGGAVAGNGLQIVGALFIIGWNIVWTSLIMILIKYVCRVPLRMTDEMCEIGDYAIHGEEPYTFEYYKRNYRRIAGYEHPGKITGEERAIRQLRQSKELGRNPDSSEGQGSGDGIIMGRDPSGTERHSKEISAVKGEKSE